MRVSVVINTYNRGRSLRNTLEALAYQTYTDFEVVVVNGPSTDCTSEVLAEFEGMVRVYRCPEPHLSKSRNIGIDHASGDIVAFIDDDGIPEPDWIADLVEAYDKPEIGGAGGLVYDHTGTTYQYEYSVCNRVARPRFDLTPPLDEYNRPGADPFVYLQGTNCSFRRQALVEIGGFDEEIEYYLDETEVCMRIIDQGYQLQSLPRAIVHHKYLASHIRNQQKVVLDPYSTVKNHCCFAIRNGTRTRPVTEVFAEVNHYIACVKAGGRGNHEYGRMTDDQLAYFLRRVEQAVEVGVRKGLSSPRLIRHIQPARPAQFLAYPTVRPTGRRLTVCFVSREYPPTELGGIGRFSSDLATGFAKLGHEVHVITHSRDGIHTVDFEQGVWMHRLPSSGPKTNAMKSMPLSFNYLHCAGIYHEISRIHANRGVDLVSAPIWLCEGAVAALDERWPTVLTLHTTMKTVQDMGGTVTDPEHVRQMIALEAATIQRSQYIYANSKASSAKCRTEGGAHSAIEYVVPHGTGDFREEYPRLRPADSKTRVLFVGRLEPRKGVDVLLEAAYQVLPQFPNVEFVLAGRDNKPGGGTYAAAHDLIAVKHPEWSSRIQFTGELTDAELQQQYADCDLFVLPSRYESFGLVLIEAMMYGKPVIASRAGGMAEIVEEGGNGYLFDVGQVSTLVQALQSLLASSDLRETFGIRSRELYEQKFSTDIMVANTIACHQSVIDHFRRTKAKTGKAVASKLMELVAGVSGVTPMIAGQAVEELMSPRMGSQYIDFAGEVTRLWSVSAEDFVKGLYHHFLGRPADGMGLKHYLSVIDQGCERMDVVRNILFSEESRLRKTDTTWLNDFIPPAVAAAPPMAIVVAKPTMKLQLDSLAQRLRRKLVNAPILGKGLRLLKHLVRLPISVRNIATHTHEHRVMLQDLHAKTIGGETEGALRRLEELHRDLMQQLQGMRDQSAHRDRQMQWQLSQQASRIEQLMTELNRMRQGGMSAAA